ncbi:hypothetical protein JCM10212_003045 [Sporobolomyces blumeae]
MFAQNNTNSPFRSSGQYGTPQQASPFAQQQPSTFGQSSSGFYGNANNQGSFSGPQFGGGGSQLGGTGSGTGYGSQFGQGPNGQPGGAYGSPFAHNSAQAQGNSAGTPSFGEAKKRNYLPGYLSGGAAAQSESTPPQSMNNETWDSPARRTSLSSSPVHRFSGGGSLFGGSTNTPSKSPKYTPYSAPPRSHAYRHEMEEDAPPVASLNEYESADQHHGAESTFSTFRPQPDVSTNSPFSAPPTALHSSSPSTTYAVNVFGFPSSALDLILDYFAQFGDIVTKTPSQEGGNWVTIEYAQPWSAARAARKNGEILGGVLMVGVKAVDEDGLKRALAASEGGQQVGNGEASHGQASGAATPRPSSTVPLGGTGSGVGKPVQVFGPSSAFKVAPTPPRKGFFGLSAGGGGTPQQAAAASSSSSSSGSGGDAHASLFAEKSKQAVMQQQQQGQGQKGVLGKVSDLVFGW